MKISPKIDKDHREWLASIVNGDEAAWVTGHSPARIVKITVRDDYFEGDGPRDFYRPIFTRKTGKGRSDFYSSTPGWIVPVTEELRRESSVEKARGRLGYTSFDRLAEKKVEDEKILAIAAILWPEEFGGVK